MIALVFSVLLSCSATPPPPAEADSLSADSLGVDTLREVTVRAGRHIPLPGMQVNPRLKDEVVSPPSLATVLERLSPGINDKITHPFAVRQRRRERRTKRSLQALENFGRARTFDELLREAYARQLREDSIAAAKQQVTEQGGPQE